MMANPELGAMKVVVWGRHMPALLLALSLMGGALLGVSPALSAVTIMICAVAFFVDVFATASINRAAMFGALFIIMCFLSGVFLGGFESLNGSSLIYWISNEGRVFLYYWPALFVMQSLSFIGMEYKLSIIYRVATLLIFSIIIIRSLTGFTTFSTYHAAGAYCAVLIFYNLFKYEKSKSVVDLFFLILSVIAMFATNSRTSLLAALISILIVYISSAKLMRVVRVAIFLSPFALAMPIVFPTQFGRLADAANTETFISLGENFARAYSADSPIEVAKAFDLSKDIDIAGNANLVIRGYLWGRSLGEGMRSPIFGIGFGRVNDLGRTYEGVPYLVYPATEATLNSPSNLTAHNGFMQVFAELGLLGSFLLFMMYRILWHGLKGGSMWVYVGRASIICLLLMSITQHAFGAPIYGLSLLLTVAVAYRMCAQNYT